MHTVSVALGTPFVQFEATSQNPSTGMFHDVSQPGPACAAGTAPAAAIATPASSATSAAFPLPAIVLPPLCGLARVSMSQRRLDVQRRRRCLQNRSGEADNSLVVRSRTISPVLTLAACAAAPAVLLAL